MNLEQVKNKKNQPAIVEDIEFDFKPITSGLGFHHYKTTEIKPTITERTVVMSPLQNTHSIKKEMSVYQSDLSIFYGQNEPATPPELVIRPVEEKTFRMAGKGQRIFAYFFDLGFILSLLGIVLTVMARTISMDLMEVWTSYPDEITPLVLILFCGFYLIYFSIFEKADQSTLGKNVFGLRVTNLENKQLSFVTLLFRSVVSLLNFVSLGLFSYFDLQNKVTSSKVIRIK